MRFAIKDLLMVTAAASVPLALASAAPFDKAGIVSASVGWLLSFLFWTIVTCGIVSLVYPWTNSTRRAKVWAYAPLLAIPAYVVYEMLMPVEMNIRVDLFLLLPILGGILVVFAAKQISFRRQSDKRSADEVDD